MLANVSTRRVERAERLARILFLLAVLAVAALVVDWEGTIGVLSAVESQAGAVAGDGAGALGAGVLLASSTVPDVVRENSAAIAALLALVLGALLILRIVSYLTTGL